jgi:hypothetical protein
MIRLLFFSIFSVFIFLGCDSKKSSNTKTAVATDTLTSKSSKEYDSSLYIGIVTGNKPDSLNKDIPYYRKRDSLFRLDNLTSSANKIEIRFFTQSFWSDTSYCIILTYDTSFYLSGLKLWYLYDSVNGSFENRKAVLVKIPIKSKPDSLWEKLIENGVFSLNDPSTKDLREMTVMLKLSLPTDKVEHSKYPLFELTKHGFIEGSMIGDVSDGPEYTLEYEVNKLYDRIDIHSPEVYFGHNPDFQLNRRKFEITKLMLSGIE